jgi:N-methylhydantoinase A/oxoprolinase/acetone carboxylase beta subunit
MKYFEDYDDFNRVVERLQAKAIKSIEDEGFRADEIVFSLELDMKYGGQLNIHRATSPRLRLETEEDARAIYLKFEREYTELYSSYSVFPQGGVEIYDFILRATVPRPKPELPTYPEIGKSPPQEALKGQRPAYWEEYKSFCDTNTYAQELLETGNTIEGPAIIEAQNTTTVLPPGIKLTIDFYHNMIIEKK